VHNFNECVIIIVLKEHLNYEVLLLVLLLLYHNKKHSGKAGMIYNFKNGWPEGFL